MIDMVLGDYLKSQDIDIFTLYKIAKHCDELVPDGNGRYKNPDLVQIFILTKGY